MIHCCVKKGRVVLKVLGEDVDQISNHTDKVFARICHDGLVGGISNLELLTEFHQLEENCFGFIRHRRSK